MKTIKKILVALALLVCAFTVGTVAKPVTVHAAETAVTDTVEETEEVATAADSTSAKAIAAAIVIGLAASAGAIAMGLAISKSSDGIARQPEASGNIRSTLMIGLVFIETAIIYALIIAILIIFVL